MKIGLKIDGIVIKILISCPEKKNKDLSLSGIKV